MIHDTFRSWRRATGLFKKLVHNNRIVPETRPFFPSYVKIVLTHLAQFVRIAVVLITGCSAVSRSPQGKVLRFRKLGRPDTHRVTINISYSLFPLSNQQLPKLEWLLVIKKFGPLVTKPRVKYKKGYQ